MRTREEHRYDVLWEVRQVVQANNWITFDTETTGLEDQIIQWAVCAPDGTILGSGFVKPTIPIEVRAREIHGITDEQLATAPAFPEIAPQIWNLFEGKTVVIYNADFDISRLCTSLLAHTDWCDDVANKRMHWLLYDLDKHCAMEWFAVIYGVWHSYFHSYTWQSLETACAYFDLPTSGMHDAACDAQATASLIQKLAELAVKELPSGYHPARNEPCAGGCGQTLGPFTYDEDHTWYCLECGLVAGLNHLCPGCEAKGKRTIVSALSVRGIAETIAPGTLRGPTEAVSSGTLCFDCQYKTNIASGAWHICPVCTRLVQATLEVQPTCTWCQKKERKQEHAAYMRRWRASHKASSTSRGISS